METTAAGRDTLNKKACHVWHEDDDDDDDDDGDNNFFNKSSWSQLIAATTKTIFKS